MSQKIDQLLENNKRYVEGKEVHKSQYPGKQKIQPSKRVAVVACMDARLDIEDILGLQTGEAHVIRNAGGVIDPDTIRSLIISHHLLNTKEFILIHHTKCGMLSFTDDLLKSGLEGDQAISGVLSEATNRKFIPTNKSSSSPESFFAFRGEIAPLDQEHNHETQKRLELDVRRSISSILNHPWIPTTGEDAITVRGFIYDVDNGKLNEVKYPE
jgi:carbonic anhydrase